MNARMKAATSRREEGSALILVLVFVVAFGIVMASILNFASTGVETAKQIGDVRDVQHAADGAIEGAINSLRTASLGQVDDTPGESSTKPCTSSNFSPPAANGDPTIVVTCTRKSLSGNPAPPTDVPNWAILTTGTAAGEGFHVNTNGHNYALQVNGGIFSYGDISVDTSGKLNVIGRTVGLACTASGAGCPASLSPSTTCDAARITSTVPVECGPRSPSSNSADAASYDYPHQAMTLPTAVPNATGTLVDPLPTCPGGTSSGVVKFVPGLYTVQPKYLAAKAGCTGSVWWFAPTTTIGTYYFRFPDADAEWRLDPPNSATVIGGTPNGWTGNSTTTQVNAILDAGNPGCVTGSDGVQFIMGGKSRMVAPQNGSYFHLCAKDPAATPPTQQRIAMYAIRPAACGCLGAETTATAVPSQARQPSSISITTSGSPAPTSSNSFPTTITMNKNPTANRTATVNVGAFEDIPEGSTINTFAVRVTRSKSDSSISESLSLTFPSGSSSSCDLSPASAGVAYTCPTIDATALGSSGLPKWRDINDMAASLSLGRGGSGANDMTYTLTNVEIVVGYTPPRFEKSTLTSSQFLLQSSNSNPTVKFYGTLLAPDSAVAVKLHNRGDSVFHRGVIARTLDAEVISSSTQDDAPFQLPSSNAGREVLLVAHLNSSTGPVRLRARVQFVDVDTKGTSDPSDDTGIPGFKVKILNWQVVRP